MDLEFCCKLPDQPDGLLCYYRSQSHWLASFPRRDLLTPPPGCPSLRPTLSERRQSWLGASAPCISRVNQCGRSSSLPSRLEKSVPPISRFFEHHGTAGPEVTPGRVLSLHCPSLSYSVHISPSWDIRESMRAPNEHSPRTSPPGLSLSRQPVFR